MSGKINLPHTCPKCQETVANDHKELEEKFGYRNITLNDRRVIVTNQSWCKKCRSKY